MWLLTWFEFNLLTWYFFSLCLLLSLFYFSFLFSIFECCFTVLCLLHHFWQELILILTALILTFFFFFFHSYLHTFIQNVGVFFLWMFLRFSLIIGFKQFCFAVTWCHFLHMLLLGIQCVSWLYVFIVFINLKTSDIISSLSSLLLLWRLKLHYALFHCPANHWCCSLFFSVFLLVLHFGMVSVLSSGSLIFASTVSNLLLKLILYILNLKRCIFRLFYNFCVFPYCACVLISCVDHKE